MAFDKKRLDTFKWLERISNKIPKGLDKPYTPYSGKIICHYGRFYATNGYILARVEWEELAHMGDEWEVVTRYADDGKFLLEFPETKPLFPHPKENTMLDDMFFYPNMRDAQGDIRDLTITPALVIDALKGFDINRLCPNITADAYRLQLDANNRHMSMSVMLMGRR